MYECWVISPNKFKGNVARTPRNQKIIGSPEVAPSAPGYWDHAPGTELKCQGSRLVVPSAAHSVEACLVRLLGARVSKSQGPGGLSFLCKRESWPSLLETKVWAFKEVSSPRYDPRCARNSHTSCGACPTDVSTCSCHSHRGLVWTPCQSLSGERRHSSRSWREAAGLRSAGRPGSAGNGHLRPAMGRLLQQGCPGKGPAGWVDATRERAAVGQGLVPHQALCQLRALKSMEPYVASG